MTQHRAKQAASPVPDDAELTKRALAGDPDAFRTIMQRYNRRLYRITRGVLRNSTDAEDAVQEAYVPPSLTWQATEASRPSRFGCPASS